MSAKVWEIFTHWSLEQSKAGVLYVPVQVKRLEKQLQVVRQARRDGRMNEPAAEAMTPSAAEMEIIGALLSLYLDTTESYADQYHDHRVMLSKAERAWQEDRLSGCVDTTDRACQKILQDIDAQIEESWAELRSAKDDLARFCEAKRITRAPENFDGQFQKGVVLAALVVVESALNAKMFASAAPGGWAEGFMVALMVSTANVGFSGGCGFLSRFANDTPVVMWRIGMAARLVWLPAVALLHGAVGRYRDLLAEDMANAAQMVISHMLASPLDVSFYSILLMGLGFIASVVALFEGARMDDAMPQLGKKARRLAKAKAKYADLKDAVLLNLQDIAADGYDAVQEEYEDAKAKLADYEDELREGVDILRRYAGMCRLLVSTCMRLVKMYKQENRAERTEKAPMYFDNEVVPPFRMDENLARELTQAQNNLDRFEPVQTLQDLQARVQETEKKIDALEDRYRKEAMVTFDRIEKGVHVPPPPLVHNNSHAVL